VSSNFFRKVYTCLTLQNIRFLYKLPFFTIPVRRCPVCGSANKKLEFVNRYTPLDRCLDCNHVYSRKVPKQRILHLMYKDIDYWAQDKHHQGITEIAYGPQWEVFLNARMGIAERTEVVLDGEAKNVFEIGCSEGILLKELEKRGHTAAGCEMNKPVAEAGMRELGVTIMTDLFEHLDLEENAYDAVLSFHTIEHIADLDVVFKKIAKILKPDGAVLIEVPCGPEEYTNTDHLQFFCEESLEKYLLRFFEDARVIPNEYENMHGTHIGSLYGVGLRPRSDL
jgi:2-polyprenyl-3-methyl-5-hydroxy-6-metoxy-1,4-benzoquinol methylase